MSEEEKKEIARERSKKYYYANKEKVLARQKKYRKDRLENATPEELKKIKKGNYSRYSKYRSDHREKIAEYQRKYIARKRGLGEVPKTKDMIINELQQENQQLKDKLSQNIDGRNYSLEDMYLLIGKLQNNWNELKNYISEQLKNRICDELYYEAFLDMNIKMKELEGNNAR